MSYAESCQEALLEKMQRVGYIVMHGEKVTE
jgi:hypothetical protein